MSIHILRWVLTMDFHKQLLCFRKQKQLTQQQLADLVQIHVNQIKRYEAGTAQPTLDALIRLAKALHVSLDALAFAEHERDPTQELKLQFEAIAQLQPDEQAVVKEVLDSLIIKYQTRRFDTSRRQDAM